MSKRTHRPMLALAGAALLSFVATAASAHAHLTASNPAADATVPAPRTLSLTFSEALEAKFSGLTLTDPKGGEIKLSVVASKDGKTLVASPAKAMAPGVYKAKWHAVAKDGHRMEGAYAFTVR